MAAVKQYAKSRTVQATGALAAGATLADWALGLAGVAVPVPVLSAAFFLLSLAMRKITRKPLEDK